MRCPICRGDVGTSANKPFCSERCQQIDLSNWLGEGYRIEVSPLESESLRLQETLLADEGLGPDVRPDDEGPSWN